MPDVFPAPFGHGDAFDVHNDIRHSGEVVVHLPIGETISGRACSGPQRAGRYPVEQHRAGGAAVELVGVDRSDERDDFIEERREVFYETLGGSRRYVERYRGARHVDALEPLAVPTDSSSEVDDASVNRIGARIVRVRYMRRPARDGESGDERIPAYRLGGAGVAAFSGVGLIRFFGRGVFDAAWELVAESRRPEPTPCRSPRARSCSRRRPRACGSCLA